jgi:hypothetical protein
MKDGKERKEYKKERKETVCLDKTGLPRNKHDGMDSLEGKHCVDVDFSDIIARRFEHLRSIMVLSPPANNMHGELHAGRWTWRCIFLAALD